LFLAMAGACTTSPAGSGGLSVDGGFPERESPGDVAVESASVEGGPADATSSSECSSEATCHAAVGGVAWLLELSGTVSSSNGPLAAKELDAFASFHAGVTHDYDDRQGGLGCFADHYATASKPMPADADAGWLRVSGFAAGPLLSGSLAMQPIQCVRSSGYYKCTYPTGTAVSDAPFAASASPLGSGPITFATNGGPDFGAVAVSGSPAGTLTIGEDLSRIKYSVTADTVLHVSCTDSCASGRIAINLTAFPSTATDGGWPYPSIGVLRCVMSGASSVALPYAGIAALLSADLSLDTILTSVAFLPMKPSLGADADGNGFTAEVGRGVFGRSSR
jgi:hypothetical protein